MDLESSYFFNPQCDNIKNLIRIVSIGLLILIVFSFLFVTSSRSVLVFIQLLQVIAVSYLVYLNLSWPTCDADTYNQNLMNASQRRRANQLNQLASGLTGGLFGTSNANRSDAIIQQPPAVG